MKTWKADRFIYKMLDGSYQAQKDETPRPAMAVELIVRRGEEIPHDMAARNGWIDRDRRDTPTAERIM